jgi:hypothetical protein
VDVGVAGEGVQVSNGKIVCAVEGDLDGVRRAAAHDGACRRSSSGRGRQNRARWAVVKVVYATGVMPCYSWSGCCNGRYIKML